MKNYRSFVINTVIGILIFGAFILNLYIIFNSIGNQYRTNVEATSEMSSQNIQSNIQAEIDRLVSTGLAMADSEYLKSWLENEPENLNNSEYDQLAVDFLSEYQSLGYDIAFFVSTYTLREYTEDGYLLTVDTSKPQSEWYTSFLASDEEYQLNVNMDSTKDQVTIFVNCKVYDDNNNVIGVVGLGIETDSIQQSLHAYEEKYDVNVMLVNSDGIVELSSDVTGNDEVNLFDDHLYAGMEDEIISQGDYSFWIDKDENIKYVSSKYIASLDWYVIVENDLDDTKEAAIALFEKLTLMTFVMIAIVSTVVNIIVRKRNRKLVEIATHDMLTGALNRVAYEDEINSLERKLTPNSRIGIGLLDLDKLKLVNDELGHCKGDEYIKISSEIFSKTFKGSKIFRIGGDEFVVLFENVSEKEVEVLKKLLMNEIEEYNSKCDFTFGISFGYSFYDSSLNESLEDVFKVADHNMYEEKVKKRNA